MDIEVKVFEGGKEPEFDNEGDLIDLYSRKVIVSTPERWGAMHSAIYEEGEAYIEEGDIVTVHLGVAISLPEGYYSRLYPRSSTFKKYGLIQTNGVGIIDHTFNGDDDELLAVFYATRPCILTVGSRLNQLEIVKGLKKDFKLSVVSKLGNPSRGGFGTTGD